VAARKANKAEVKKPGRAGVPHYSLYIAPIVVKEIRRLAVELDKRPHELLLEGIDMMLKKRGRTSIAELTGRQ
jgi:hypothetical protein